VGCLPFGHLHGEVLREEELPGSGGGRSGGRYVALAVRSRGVMFGLRVVFWN